MEQFRFSSNDIAVLKGGLCTDDLQSAVRMFVPFPPAAMKALEILNRSDPDIHELAQVAASDEEMRSSVLRMCNSSFFGFVRRISSIEQAAEYLGTSQLKEIFLTCGLKRVFFNGAGVPGKLASDLWKHSLGCAVMARVLAQRLDVQYSFTLYTLALLHDVGKLVLDRVDSEMYSSVCNYARIRRLTLLEAERRILGAGHPEAGAMLVEEWGFPEMIAHCVRFHHEPDMSSHPPLLSALGLADFLTNYIGLTLAQTAGLPAPQTDAARRLGLLRDQMDEVITEFFNLYERAEVLVNLVA